MTQVYALINVLQIILQIIQQESVFYSVHKHLRCLVNCLKKYAYMNVILECMQIIKQEGVIVHVQMAHMLIIFQ